MSQKAMLQDEEGWKLLQEEKSTVVAFSVKDKL